VPILCHEAANPAVYKPYELPYECDVVFIGAPYGDRVEYVRALVDAGIDIRVFGLGWLDLGDVQPITRRVRHGAGRVKRAILRQHARARPLPNSCLGGPLDDEEMVRMYSRSRVSLGFANVGETHRTSAPITQVRLRDFEAPMSGAFYMPQWSSEIHEYFAEGKEVVCFGDSRDLVAKVAYYLEHADERESIRAAGLRRALRDHTWQRRLTEAFSAMGLD
jgi:spore maturation protein CgeB